MSKILIIGGAGFIGKALTARLVAAGNEVTVVSRSAGSRGQQGPVRYLSAQVADAKRIHEVVAGNEYVYDLSMSLGAKWEDYERDYITGARNVGRACLDHGVKRLFYTSSISALYLGTGRPVTEADGYDSKPLERGFYGRGKIEAERVLNQMHVAEKLPVTIFRPGIVLGPGGMLVHGALGEPVSDIFIFGFGPGTYRLPCVLADDVAQAMVLAIAAPGIEGQSFNLAGPVQPTAREYVAELRARTHRPFAFHSRSLTAIAFGEWLRWAIKAATRKPGNVRGSSRDARSLSMSSYLDCSLAQRVLGWKPVSDRDEFFHQALDSHLEPLPASDLRLLPRFRVSA